MITIMLKGIEEISYAQLWSLHKLSLWSRSCWRARRAASIPISQAGSPRGNVEQDNGTDQRPVTSLVLFSEQFLVSDGTEQDRPTELNWPVFLDCWNFSHKHGFECVHVLLTIVNHLILVLCMSEVSLRMCNFNLSWCKNCEPIICENPKVQRCNFPLDFKFSLKVKGLEGTDLNFL